MNNELFQHARSAYVAKDFETALADFTECLQDSTSELAPGELGLLYHQIGNCLVKLHDPNEAIIAYTQAMQDAHYDGQSSLAYNMGTVYAAQNDYENAIPFFEKALEDPNYRTAYKAYMSMGNSLLKLGKSAEAGAAFRSAALDEANPDPTKALLNLGVCFMALDRPLDAIASYESALQFDMPSETRNRLFANMGQAYVAAGKMDKAVRVFESALADKTYVFNDAASVDYQRAIKAVASGNAEDHSREPQESTNDLSGLDVMGDGVPVAYDDSIAEAGTMLISRDDINEGINAYNDPLNTDFFDDNEVRLQDWTKTAKRKGRHRGLKIFIIILIVLAILAAGAFFVVKEGLGFPSKDDATVALFTNPDDPSVYADSLDETSRERIASMLTTDSSPEVVGSTTDLMNAKVYVDAKTAEGGVVPYEISLTRSGLGWKVTGVSLYFASQH